MKFFQLVEKAGERKGVHSSSDLDYMLSRGWTAIEIPKNVPIEKPKPVKSIAVKKKRGRPRKVK